LFPFIFQINMKNLQLSLFSKILLLLTAALFIGSIFVPMWRIELDAPQYPEGLVLQLHANKIGGDVEIINGLNHYIGMKTLHTENFIEFKILPYIFVFFSVFALINIFIAKRKLLYTLFASLLIFGILAAIDFYRWNYNYGHDLDPNAAIKVPGMAYQPPLLGYKQLLNFGAYSVPDIGGWMLIFAGIFIFLVILKETKFNKKQLS
jgi:copper chaperone NosL